MSGGGSEGMQGYQNQNRQPLYNGGAEQSLYSGNSGEQSLYSGNAGTGDQSLYSGNSGTGDQSLYSGNSGTGDQSLYSGTGELTRQEREMLERDFLEREQMDLAMEESERMEREMLERDILGSQLMERDILAGGAGGWGATAVPESHGLRSSESHGLRSDSPRTDVDHTGGGGGRMGLGGVWMGTDAPARYKT
ncbi:hypothetical protein T484DRAFT_1890087 [Baffinella frigidus]|nr:hypothetical protein T484DRAFT_1890087 [Cryptophyta sp. CCMP2293]